jgi:membrane associated rhomboid family serine protease
MLYAILAVNVAVFLAWHSLPPQFMAANFLVSAERVFSAPWTLLTSAVSHLDATHLLFNAIGLYVFGREFEARFGPRAFLHLYVAGGVVASLGHVLLGMVMGDAAPALGASGAVMALAVVYGGLFPQRTLMVNFLIPVKARILVALYILMDLFGVMGGGTGIAHGAHLGGALYGLIYYLTVLRPLTPRRGA